MLIIPRTALQNPVKVRVACIGNSVTYGAGIKDREQNAYPAQLQKLLGAGYEVGNFGVNGATLLRKGHSPYHQTQQYQDALAFQPGIAIIHLGLNDTDPRNWPEYRDDFAGDYYHLIDTLRAVNPDVRILICRLTPIFSGHPRFKSGTRDWFWEIQSLLPLIAENRQVELVDLHTPLYHRPDLFPDELHPVAEGAAIIAATIGNRLTGKYGGLQLPRIFADHMVLQQQMPIPVQGIANAGEEVTIMFGDNKVKVTADVDGQWKTVLSSREAGGPFQLEVTTDTEKIRISDIMVGEVWLCAGQSNMAFPIKEAIHTNADMQEAQQASSMRLLKMTPLVETGNFAWDAVTLEKVNQLKYFSGIWQRCDSTAAKDFSAVAYYFGKQLHHQLNVPIGLIQVAVGGSNTESWIDRFTMEHHPQLVDMVHHWRTSDYIMPWCRERAGKNLENATVPKQRHPYQPCYNFEAGIAPLTFFPVKGVIWYQGESNAHNIELHEELFKTLVKSWRQQWDYNFPFYYVQLSSLDRPSWPHFRDSQRRLLQQTENTGMAVSSDAGDPEDVHPKQKRPVGERLAAWALANTYEQALIYSGPLFKEVRFSGNQAICTFQFGEGLGTSDQKEVRGFEMAGSDLIFSKAKAVVRQDCLAISSDKVAEPKYVRYGWQPFTTANLVNKAGFPASTFSTFSFSHKHSVR